MDVKVGFAGRGPATGRFAPFATHSYAWRLNWKERIGRPNDVTWQRSIWKEQSSVGRIWREPNCIWPIWRKPIYTRRIWREPLYAGPSEGRCPYAWQSLRRDPCLPISERPFSIIPQTSEMSFWGLRPRLRAARRCAVGRYQPRRYRLVGGNDAG